MPARRLDLRGRSSVRFVAEAPAAELPRESPVEPELRELGRSLAAAFPSRARHPLKALDARAMERSSEDAELRAALFRLVDVTPACRSLDDLARHLSAYLEDVEERRQPLRAAMRVAGTAPGRRALGAAAAAAAPWRRARRPRAHRHGVARLARDDAGAGVRAPGGGGDARRPVGRAGAPGVLEGIAGTPRAHPALRCRDAPFPAARGPPREGGVLGPRGRGGPPARLAPAGVRAQGRLRSQLRGAHPPPRGRPPAGAR